MPNYEAEARRAARKYGVNPDIFVAQIRAESNFNPNARSPAGAQGIAQFIPSTARAYGVNLGDSRASDDLDGAARYMRDNLRRTGGNYTQALSIYNSGRPDGYKTIAETRNYVSKILGSAKSSPTQAPTPKVASKPADASSVAPNTGASKQQLLLGYLAQRDNPNALLSLASGLQQLGPETPRYGPAAAPEPQRRGGTRKMTRRSAPKGAQLLEMFYNGPGGVNVDNGKRVPRGFVDGHAEHVHVASGPKTILQIAKLAQDMGLAVRELAPYDKVDPVHTANSYHYSNQAADISGDPRVMAQFSRRVARMFGVKP